MSPSVITIKREKAVFGSGVACVIYDNGQAVGQLGSDGTLKWERNAGYMELRVQPQDYRLEDVTDPGETRSYFVPSLTLDAGVAKGFRCNSEKPLAIAPKLELAKAHYHLKEARREKAIKSFSLCLRQYGDTEYGQIAIAELEDVVRDLLARDLSPSIHDESLLCLMEYIRALPAGRHARKASDILAYCKAESTLQAIDLKRYLETYPEGAYAEQATRLLTIISEKALMDKQSRDIALALRRLQPHIKQLARPSFIDSRTEFAGEKKSLSVTLSDGGPYVQGNLIREYKAGSPAGTSRPLNETDYFSGTITVGDMTFTGTATFKPDGLIEPRGALVFNELHYYYYRNGKWFQSLPLVVYSNAMYFKHSD
jgi:hypothetical protein